MAARAHTVALGAVALAAAAVLLATFLRRRGSASASPMARAIATVRRNVSKAMGEAGRSSGVPRIVLVSKTKPPELIMEAYAAGERIFGENYVQELVEKAPALPADIAWHFIGHLQSNKAKQICSIPNLACVESVDSPRIADALDKACAAVGRRTKLRIFVQVNSSGEESKSGVGPDDTLGLWQHVMANCQHLECVGMMTIGALDYSPNPECFQRMLDCRSRLAAALGLAEEHIELSMGMSSDYESAVRMGSTNVRIGSSVFGSRAQKRS